MYSRHLVSLRNHSSLPPNVSQPNLLFLVFGAREASGMRGRFEAVDRVQGNKQRRHPVDRGSSVGQAGPAN